MMKISKNNKMSYNLDGISINKSLIEKFLLKEKEKQINLIDDLSQLNTKSESELLEVIGQMMKNKTFFIYCHSLLININPGPEYVYDYLNLKDWIINENNNKESKNEKNEIKPHLYSFIQYVYETMIKDNKDQVVSILGPLGAGKTFNLIHIMEYITTLYSYPNYDSANFELIHKSIQFIHILGSIFRENNLESSSCGILLNIGFNQNNLICSFDIEAQILDYTLPFNDKGRTFSIFHALIAGANEDLKRKYKISNNDDNLFNIKTNKKNIFFRNAKEKEKFRLNDLEIWNRFYSLLKYFHFTKNEMIDIINSFSFILNINELMIIKVKGGKLKNIDYFEFQKGITTKKICKNLGLTTDDKIDEFEDKLKEYRFKTLEEAELFLQGLMKQTYYIIFEYALQKIKSYINDYFNKITKNYNSNINKTKSKQINEKLKYIYFIDFPGEVEAKNLGGFTTNIAHECLNMYSASAYYEIVEKILLENVLLKKFKPLKSYAILTNCFNKDGIIDNFSKPLNTDNFLDMKNNILENLNIYNCYKFPEKRKNNESNYEFFCSFSEKNVLYNYEYLHYESKSLLFNEKIFNILSLAKNIVISSTFKNGQTKLQSLNNFYNFYSSCLYKFFNPIKNLKPFVVYCLHSNDSYKYFFSKKDENKFKNINDNNSEVPIDLIKHSMIPAILNWNWYGFKEWIKIDDFLKAFENDFEKIKNRIIIINSNDNKNKIKFEENNLDFTNLSKIEKAKCILNILARDMDYILGSEYIIMKTGSLKRIAIYFNSMVDTIDEIGKNLLYKLKSAKTINNTTSSKNNEVRKNIKFYTNEKKKSKTKDENTNSSNMSKKNSFSLEKNLDKQPLPKRKDINNLDINIYKENPDERRSLLKDQCSLNIISAQNNNFKLLNDEEKNNALKSKYLNINYILGKNKNKKSNNKIENEKLEELINYKDEKTKKNIPSKNNTVVSDPVIFNKIKSLFDPSKSKNIKLFDYSDNIDSIVKLQTIIRRLNAKKKFRILKYISKYIIVMQKFMRGFICRKKVKFYFKCAKCIFIIQRLYKKRYKKLNECAKKIQKYYRLKKDSRRERDKLILKMKLDAEKEKYEFINVDKVMDNVLKNKEEDIHDIVLNIGKTNNVDNIYKNKKISKIDATNDLIHETNKGRVIDLLLYSQMPYDEKIYRKKMHRSKSDFYKIEDKLIYQGKQTQKIREKKKQESMQKVDPNLYFNPKISKKNYEITNKYPDDFLKRVEYYKLFKKRNLENLRNRFLLNIMSNMRFEPQLNKNSNIKSKVFNNNLDKLPKDNINKVEEKKENILNEEKINDNKTNINKFYSTFNRPKKFVIKDDEMKKYNSLNQSEEIWPKEQYHKYLESRNIENNKSSN